MLSIRSSSHFSRPVLARCTYLSSGGKSLLGGRRLSCTEGGAQSPPEVVQPVVVAQNAPYEFPVVKDQRYSWCTCGRSAKQPLCDGAHKGTGLKPLRMVAEEDGTLFLCGCKHTTTGPFCDGTHAKYAGW